MPGIENLIGQKKERDRMTHIATPIYAIAAAALLSGCVETTGGGTSQMPVAAGGPPFITSMAPDVSQAAINACRAALESTTSGGVTVEGGETSEAATAIYMRVGANGAPWRCLVSADGGNPSLMFMGDEGAL